MGDFGVGIESTVATESPSSDRQPEQRGAHARCARPQARQTKRRADATSFTLEP